MISLNNFLKKYSHFLCISIKHLTFNGKHSVAEIFKVDPSVSIRVQALGQFFYLKEDRSLIMWKPCCNIDSDHIYTLSIILFYRWPSLLRWTSPVCCWLQLLHTGSSPWLDSSCKQVSRSTVAMSSSSQAETDLEFHLDDVVLGLYFLAVNTHTNCVSLPFLPDCLSV